jgi:hypothetical protein
VAWGLRELNVETRTDTGSNEIDRIDCKLESKEDSSAE